MNLHTSHVASGFSRTGAVRLKADATGPAVALAVVFLAFHLLYLPTSLEDVDSINFALGIRDFDVAQHQPHPPGYPLFIAAGKVANAVVRSEARALATVSVLSGALGVLAIAVFFRRIATGWSLLWVSAATALAMTAPLYWFTSARPLSDVTGLAAAVAVQAAIVAANSRRALIAASMLAAIAAGIRSQVLWLTVPLLVVKAIDLLALHHGGPGGHGDAHVKDSRSVAPASSAASFFGIVAAYIIGVLVWAIPLVIFNGGPVRYWRVLFSQGAEDFIGVRMLWTTRNVRALADAMYHALVAPWAAWPIAAAVLALAAAGTVAVVRRNRGAAIALAAAFGPYFCFNLVFQEIVTTRYALPLVVPVAFLATAGARLIPKAFGVAAVVVIAVVCGHIGGTSIAAYSRAKPPAFRLIDDMRRVAASASRPPVLAMDRREEFDFRRPMTGVGDAPPRFAAKLPSPPQHEWLEAVKYWNSGGRAPVWYVADPLRADVDLVDHPAPFEYRWPLPYPVLIGGVRPNEMRWLAIESPEWYVGAGWALTPESAGVSEVDRRGVRFGPIEAWVARSALGGTMAIGGRNFEGSQHVRVDVRTSGREVTSIDAAPGAFAQLVPLPTDMAAGGADYLTVTVSANPRGRVALEQFQASAKRPVFVFANGWHEPEYNPQNGLRWRWLSEEGELRFVSPAPDATLHLEGEAPRTYFSRPSRLVIRAGDRVLLDRLLAEDFQFDVPLPPRAPRMVQSVTFTTDQVFSPADRARPWRRSGDKRHLGLRIFKCEIRTAS